MNLAIRIFLFCLFCSVAAAQNPLVSRTILLSTSNDLYSAIMNRVATNAGFIYDPSLGLTNPAVDGYAVVASGTDGKLRWTPLLGGGDVTSAQLSSASNSLRHAWIDVTKPPYSAPTNGTDDATFALNSAFTNANGKTVHFPHGTYRVSELWLSALTNTIIVGDGSIIKPVAGTTSASDWIRVFNSPNLIVSDLVIDGNHEQLARLVTISNSYAPTFNSARFLNHSNLVDPIILTAFVRDGCGPVTFNACTFHGTVGTNVSYMLDIDYSSNTNSPSWPMIFGSHFEDSQPSIDAAAIYVQSRYHSGIGKIVNSTFKDMTKRAIKLRGDNFTVAGCTATFASGAIGTAFASPYGRNITITDCKVYSQGTGYVDSFFDTLGESGNVTVTGNTLSNSIFSDFRFATLWRNATDSTEDVKVIGNTVINTGTGVSSTQPLTNILISANSFLNTTGVVVFLGGDVDSVRIVNNYNDTNANRFATATATSTNLILAHNISHSRFGFVDTDIQGFGNTVLSGNIDNRVRVTDIPAISVNWTNISVYPNTANGITANLWSTGGVSRLTIRLDPLNTNWAQVYHYDNNDGTFLDTMIGSRNMGQGLHVKGASGYVGIGTTNPAATLHVNGGVYVDGGQTNTGYSAFTAGMRLGGDNAANGLNLGFNSHLFHDTSDDRTVLSNNFRASSVYLTDSLRNQAGTPFALTTDTRGHTNTGPVSITTLKANAWPVVNLAAPPYNATGSASQDITSILQDAVASFPLTGTIILPAKGKLTGTVWLTNWANIVGNGKSELYVDIAGATNSAFVIDPYKPFTYGAKISGVLILKASGGDAEAAIRIAPASISRAVSEYTISDNYFDKFGAGAKSIIFDGGVEDTIFKITIEKNRFDGSISGFVGDNVVINNNRFHSTATNSPAIALSQNVGATGLYITHNNSVAREFAWITNSSGPLIAYNNIEALSATTSTNALVLISGTSTQYVTAPMLVGNSLNFRYASNAVEFAGTVKYPILIANKFSKSTGGTAVKWSGSGNIGFGTWTGNLTNEAAVTLMAGAPDALGSVVDPEGRVGIGTNAPAKALSVHGGVQFVNLGASNAAPVAAAVFDANGNLTHGALGSSTGSGSSALSVNSYTKALAYSEVTNATLDCLSYGASGGTNIQLTAVLTLTNSTTFLSAANMPTNNIPNLSSNSVTGTLFVYQDSSGVRQLNFSQADFLFQGSPNGYNAGVDTNAGAVTVFSFVSGPYGTNLFVWGGQPGFNTSTNTY